MVNEVFTNVAETYDKMNDAMSFGIHRCWKGYGSTNNLFFTNLFFLNKIFNKCTYFVIFINIFGGF